MRKVIYLVPSSTAVAMVDTRTAQQTTDADADTCSAIDASAKPGTAPPAQPPSSSGTSALSATSAARPASHTTQRAPARSRALCHSSPARQSHSEWLQRWLWSEEQATGDLPREVRHHPGHRCRPPVRQRRVRAALPSNGLLCEVPAAQRCSAAAAGQRGGPPPRIPALGFVVVQHAHQHLGMGWRQCSG